MQKVIWLNDTIDPALIQHLTGQFRAAAAWAECLLDLQITREGVVKGYFTVAEQTFEIKGGFGKTGQAYGFLLEPLASVPMALFRITPHQDQLTLELDVPDFEELLEHCTLERFCLSRVDATP